MRARLVVLASLGILAGCAKKPAESVSGNTEPKLAGGDEATTHPEPETLVQDSGDAHANPSHLLDAAQVATVPGVVFGQHGEAHLRFSFSTSLEAIEAGLESMRKKL